MADSPAKTPPSLPLPKELDFQNQDQIAAIWELPLEERQAYLEEVREYYEENHGPTVRDIAFESVNNKSSNDFEWEVNERLEKLQIEQEARRRLKLGDSAGENKGDSWEPKDLSEALNGKRELLKPVMLCREDGACLLYPGKVHSFNAEPESGKTWLMLAASAQELQEGAHVFYIDYESDDVEICSRLVSLGVAADLILSNFHYWNPEDAYEPGVLDSAVKQWSPSLVVLDGVGAAMNVQGLRVNDNDEATAFMVSFPRRLALTGATVALTDHVVKRKEDRGGFGIGAQAKKGLVDVTYELRSKVPFSRGSEGSTDIIVTKDRPGGVRAVSEAKRHFGEMRLASSELEQGSVEITIVSPKSGISAVLDVAIPPDHVLVAISRFVEDTEEPLSFRKIRDGIAGIDNNLLINGTKALINMGYLVNLGTDNRAAISNVKPYRAG